MKICNHSPCLFGKIKIWDEPFFDLDEIEQDLSQFRLDLIENLQIQVGQYYVKPPNPNTVLGKFIETIRFTTAYFNPPLELVKNFDFGIGECGYYYDIHIDSNGLTIGELCVQIEKLTLFLIDFEKQIESKLTEYYFELPHQRNFSQFQEISNFDLTIESEPFFFGLLSGSFKDMNDVLKKSSNEIIRDQINIIQPIFRFNIHSLLKFSDPIQYMQTPKYLENERFLEFHQIPNQAHQWRILARGVPIPVLCSLFDNSSAVSSIADKKPPIKKSARKQTTS
jgi:hypothetical protein